MRIGDALFQVIGVLESSGSSGFGSSDSQVFVPINVAHGRLFNADRYRGSYMVSSISIQVVSQEALDATETQIEQVLRLRHGLGTDDDNDFSISNQADLLDMASSVSGTLSSLLGGIGAVSLVVGGIGIMNIMLVSVTERTREIGLRKAVGAHDRDILLQFLVEALVLCTLGGLIGIGDWVWHSAAGGAHSRGAIKGDHPAVGCRPGPRRQQRQRLCLWSIPGPPRHATRPDRSAALRIVNNKEESS